jgi:hypothetical protein
LDAAVLSCVGLQPHGLLASLHAALGHPSTDASGAPAELQEAIQQLRQLDIPEQQLASDGQLLAALAGLAQGDAAAGRSYRAVLQQRQRAALAGNPAVLASLTGEELRALSDPQFRRLQAQLRRLEEQGAALAAALLQQQQGQQGQQQQQQQQQAPAALTADDLHAVAWHMRAEPAERQRLLLERVAAVGWLAAAAARPLCAHAGRQAAQQLRSNLALEAELAALSPLVRPRLFGGELLDPALEAQLEAAAAAPEAPEQQQQAAHFVEQVRGRGRRLPGCRAAGPGGPAHAGLPRTWWRRPLLRRGAEGRRYWRQLAAR